VKTNIQADHKNERERATQQDFSSQGRAPGRLRVPKLLRPAGQGSSAGDGVKAEVV